MANSNFFSLPRELRDEIYRFLISYPEIDHLQNAFLEKARAALSSHFRTEISEANLERLLEWTAIGPPKRPPLQTPAILLLNRQITSEALQILHSNYLCLDVPISSNFNRDVAGLQITDFISAPTLGRVRYACLHLSFPTLKEANCWYRTVVQLWNVWRRFNSLKGLSVHAAPVFGLENDHERAVTRRLVINKLMDFKKIAPTKYEGDLVHHVK